MLLGLEKAACLHRARAHCIRMPEFEGAWQLARDKPSGTTKFMNKYAAFSLLVIDEWLLDDPDESTRSMLLELLERRYDQASTVFCTHDVRGDWHQRLATGRPRRLLAEGPQHPRPRLAGLPPETPGTIPSTTANTRTSRHRRNQPSPQRNSHKLTEVTPLSLTSPEPDRFVKGFANGPLVGLTEFEPATP